jgi:excisionase family DNA binding protein
LRYLVVMGSAYLTVPQVAAELDMTPDGVYKLIKRGRLPAIRRSERGIRVARVALAAYLRRLQGEVSDARAQEVNPQELSMDVDRLNVDRLRTEFERETGLSPGEWERRWKADKLEDSAANMRLAIRALSLLAAEQQRLDSGQEPRRRPAAHSR